MHFQQVSSHGSLCKEKYILCNHKSSSKVFPSWLQIHAWQFFATWWNKRLWTSHEIISRINIYRKTFERKRRRWHHSSQKIYGLTKIGIPSWIPCIKIYRKPIGIWEEKVRFKNVCINKRSRSCRSIPLQRGFGQIRHSQLQKTR